MQNKSDNEFKKYINQDEGKVRDMTALSCALDELTKSFQVDELHLSMCTLMRVRPLNVFAVMSQEEEQEEAD